MASEAPTTGSESTPTSMRPSPSHFSTPTPKRGGDLAHRGAQIPKLLHGTVVAVVADEVGEPAEIDEGERAMDTVV